MTNKRKLINKTHEFSQRAERYLSYTLSIPERGIRSLAALLGGSINLLSHTLFPDALRNSSSYHFTLGMFQAFLTTRVAGMQFNDPQTELGDKYIQRKIVGSTLEAAGLLTMRMSPIWLFAIASDTANGSKIFLNRLVNSLKQNNVIEQNAQPTELVDVLEAIQQASRKSAKVADTPPLSKDELKNLANEMRTSYSKVFSSAGNIVPDFDKLWLNMKEVSQKENISMEKLTGIMTIDAVSIVKNSMGTASAVGKTSYQLFDEVVLDSYKQTLENISSQGVDTYLQTHLGPFVKAAHEHFDPNKKTLIEKCIIKIKSKFNKKPINPIKR